MQTAEGHASTARSQLERAKKQHAEQLEELSVMIASQLSEIFTLTSIVQQENYGTSSQMEGSSQAQDSEAQRQRSTASNSHIGHNCSTDHQRLQMENDRLRKKYDEAERAVKDLQSEVAESKSREKILTRNLEAIKMGSQSNTSSNDCMANFVEQLANQVEELEKEKDMLAPLLRVGAAVRLRNLEQALETIMDVRHRDLNQAAIRTGNIAAHRANGLADCALFEGGFVAEEFMEKATKVFEKLYQVTPSAYRHFDSRSRRVIDCEATMATHKTLNRYNNTSNLRVHYAVLNADLTHMINGEMPSTSETIDGLLGHIERITEDIVDVERSLNRRRG